MRTSSIVAGVIAIAGSVVAIPACSSSSAAPATCSNGQQDGDETGRDCGGACGIECVDGAAPEYRGNGVKDNGETDVDCGGPVAPKCGDGKSCLTADDCASAACDPTTKTCAVPRPDDKIKNGGETDVDCGGPNAPKCAEGLSCLVDADCRGACNYAKKCVDAPSCKPHLGGDTCGKGEVGETGAVHESCCRTLPVPGYEDPRNPGKQVYLDKYEITAGRIRAFLADITAKQGGKPNVRQWINANTPPIWDPAWNVFLPADNDGETVRINRLLLGDRRNTPDAPPVPEADQDRKTGVDFQFNGQLFVYLHGNNCSTHAPSAFGFPTWFYPADVLAKMGSMYPPRADGETNNQMFIPANEHLDVKAMNCITNALLQAFCHWDGGQLATDAVLDYVTDSPASLGDRPGCGSQVGTENPPKSDAATKGGRCAELSQINATFDAGAMLPEPNSPLNKNNYVYPFFPGSPGHDKAWLVSAPGRGSVAASGEQVDTVRINPGDEPWMDLAGNLNEAVLKTEGATFTGKFGLKFRGVGYQSARSELNYKNDWEGEGGIRRIERPEARAAFAGGRCMRFR